MNHQGILVVVSGFSGAGKGSRKHLGRKDTVEKSLYFGMNPIDSCHLRFVGAGHYGSLHPIPV